MSSHTTAMQQVTKEELDMISSVADIGTDEVNESSFLRRSGRLTKSQPAPIVESLSPREGTPEAAITPKPARQIAAMKGKGMTPTDRKSPAKGKLSIAAKTAVTTGSTTQETSMDITPKSSSEVATKETTVAKSTGRTSSVNGQNPSNAVKSKAAIARQQDSAASSKAKTSPNTDDVDEEMSGAVDDAHDDDFIPDVAPLETATSGMLSLPPLGGAIPASPPSSDDALSPSKKRKSDGNNSKDGPSAKRSNTEKQPSKAKSSQDKESKPIPQGPLPHGRPLVWAEVSSIACPDCLSLLMLYLGSSSTLRDSGLLSRLSERRVYLERCGIRVSLGQRRWGAVLHGRRGCDREMVSNHSFSLRWILIDDLVEVASQRMKTAIWSKRPTKAAITPEFQPGTTTCATRCQLFSSLVCRTVTI